MDGAGRALSPPPPKVPLGGLGGWPEDAEDMEAGPQMGFGRGRSRKEHPQSWPLMGPASADMGGRQGGAEGTSGAHARCLQDRPG